MKKIFIVANWKSNKTIPQAEEWFQTINNSPVTFNKEEKEVIVCPPFTLLSRVKELAVKSQLSIVVGAQDVSPFEDGAYTGEVSARQIKEFSDYVIVGHSERRENFSEDDKTLFGKFELAKQYRLIPIFCVQGKETKIPSNSVIIAYEPINAIGTGDPDTPENAEDVAFFFKNNHNIQSVLYGGSVSANNVGSFTKMSHIDGVLVGKASLDPLEFLEIIKNA